MLLLSRWFLSASKCFFSFGASRWMSVLFVATSVAAAARPPNVSFLFIFRRSCKLAHRIATGCCSRRWPSQCLDMIYMNYEHMKDDLGRLGHLKWPDVATMNKPET